MRTVEAEQKTFIVLPTKKDFDGMILIEQPDAVQALCRMPCRQPCVCSCHVHMQDSKKEESRRF